MFLQLLSGVIYSLSFNPVGLWFLAPVAIALQIFLLRRFRFPELQSFIFAFTSSLIILSWTKTFVGVLPWISLAILQGVLAIPIGLTARISRHFAPLVFVILLMEEARARFPFGGFSWTRIAFSQVESPIAPIVGFTGMIGLSLATLLIAQFVLHPSWKFAALPIALTISSLLITPFGENQSSLQVRGIQGGVPERGLEFNRRAQAVLDAHIRATIEEVQAEDELILWPENAIDIDPNRNAEVGKKLDQLARQIEKPIIAGAILDEAKLYNATILIDSTGAIQSTYRKRYLTPFGEYIPLRSFVSKFSPHTDRVTDFSPGDSLEIHRVKGSKVASIICYELLNDGLVRDASANSDLIVVHTNSATFSGSSEGEQQLAITRLRALESQKSILSISTTGPSAIIDARGEVLEKLADGDIGSISGQLPLRSGESLSHRLGGLIPLLVLLFTFIWAIVAERDMISKVRRRATR